MTQTVAVEIVWRNPKPPQRRQRWEQINKDSRTTRYLVQKCVSTRVGSFLDHYVELGISARWSSRLVVLRGWRADVFPVLRVPSHDMLYSLSRDKL
jgi:hypothetical protein